MTVEVSFSSVFLCLYMSESVSSVFIIVPVGQSVSTFRFAINALTEG